MVRDCDEGKLFHLCARFTPDAPHDLGWETLGVAGSVGKAGMQRPNVR
jgi:hypothetical protein